MILDVWQHGLSHVQRDLPWAWQQLRATAPLQELWPLFDLLIWHFGTTAQFVLLLWLGGQVCAWQRSCSTVSYKSVVARETGTGSESAGWKFCDGADDESSRGSFWCTSWCSAAWDAGLSELHYSELLPSHLLVFVLTLGQKKKNTYCFSLHLGRQQWLCI